MRSLLVRVLFSQSYSEELGRVSGYRGGEMNSSSVPLMYFEFLFDDEFSITVLLISSISLNSKHYIETDC